MKRRTKAILIIVGIIALLLAALICAWSMVCGMPDLCAPPPLHLYLTATYMSIYNATVESMAYQTQTAVATASSFPTPPFTQ